MPEQLLDCADVVAVLEHMGGEAVAQGMGGDALLEPTLLRGALDCLADGAGVNVVTADLP
jgi:hypothetical protein